MYSSDVKELWWKEKFIMNNFRKDFGSYLNKRSSAKIKKGKIYKCEKTIIIGDKLSTEIGFGMNAGMATVKVDPIDW
jgi:ribonucleotide monophosphatase NagD (HAD superfamily)